MPEKVRKPRSKHSYRDRIREVIRHRIYRGDPLRTYEIIDEAGGGSASTVQQELKAMLEGDTVKPAVLAGFDHADPATCEPGVDAKDNHDDFSSSSWAITSSEAVQLE